MYPAPCRSWRGGEAANECCGGLAVQQNNEGTCVEGDGRKRAGVMEGTTGVSARRKTM